MARKRDKNHNPASASDLVPVTAIIPETHDGGGAVVILNDGSYRMILATGSVNFDHTSRYEKAGIVGSFQALVDSLDIDEPIQIVSVPRQLDVNNYVSQFMPTLNDPQAPQSRKALARAHMDFYTEQARSLHLLQRNLYVVVPYKGPSGPVTESLSDQMPFMGIFGALAPNVTKKFVKHNPTPAEIEMARHHLEDRVSMIESGLMQIGIRVVHRLGVDEVMQLLYEAFHPGLAERQRMSGGDFFRIAPALPPAPPREIAPPPAGATEHEDDDDDDDFYGFGGTPVASRPLPPDDAGSGSVRRRRRPGGGAAASLPAPAEGGDDTW